jgi:Myosin N-terminal SH3-like domain
MRGTPGLADKVGQIEGENDFSGKRYVWVKDPDVAFVKGFVVEEHEEGMVTVQCDDGSVRTPTFSYGRGLTIFVATGGPSRFSGQSQSSQI